MSAPRTMYAVRMSGAQTGAGSVVIAVARRNPPVVALGPAPHRELRPAPPGEDREEHEGEQREKVVGPIGRIPPHDHRAPDRRATRVTLEVDVEVVAARRHPRDARRVAAAPLRP